MNLQLAYTMNPDSGLRSHCGAKEEAASPVPRVFGCASPIEYAESLLSLKYKCRRDCYRELESLTASGTPVRSIPVKKRKVVKEETVLCNNESVHPDSKSDCSSKEHSHAAADDSIRRGQIQQMRIGSNRALLAADESNRKMSRTSDNTAIPYEGFPSCQLERRDVDCLPEKHFGSFGSQLARDVSNSVCLNANQETLPAGKQTNGRDHSGASKLLSSSSNEIDVPVLRGQNRPISSQLHYEAFKAKAIQLSPPLIEKLPASSHIPASGSHFKGQSGSLWNQCASSCSSGYKEQTTSWNQNRTSREQTLQIHQKFLLQKALENKQLVAKTIQQRQMERARRQQQVATEISKKVVGSQSQNVALRHHFNAGLEYEAKHRLSLPNLLQQSVDVTGDAGLATTNQIELLKHLSRSSRTDASVQQYAHSQMQALHQSFSLGGLRSVPTNSADVATNELLLRQLSDSLRRQGGP